MWENEKSMSTLAVLTSRKNVLTGCPLGAAFEEFESSRSGWCPRNTGKTRAEEKRQGLG